jgi:F-type H+-transporting ATPase subunit b
MQIDWFTTGAQIINFLILIWLLKKFLYRPVIEAMESREQNLVMQRQSLATEQAEAELLKKHYESHLHQLNIEKDKILSEAREQAETDRTEQLLGLEDEIQHKKNQFAEEMHKQQQELVTVISKVIAEKALHISSKILLGLADQLLEQKMVEHFLRHLEDLPGDEQALLHKAIRQDSSVRIITRFPLDEALCQKIQSYLDKLTTGCNIFYELNEHFVCGIALEAGGRRWEWNIDRYLAELETELLEPVTQHS